MNRHFNGFEIKYAKTNQAANLDEVDVMVCEGVGLEDRENDYGHFYFPEAKNPDDSWRQKSISWVGLLHCIIHYSFNAHLSSIRHGYRDVYEILGALVELRQYIKFPHSTIPFLARLLNFLKAKGLYVYVNYNESDDRDLYENLTHTEKLKFLKTDSGWFECNENGILMNFYPDLNENSVVKVDKSLYDRHRIIHLRHFIIPEGVKGFSAIFLRKGWGSGNVVFPQSFDADICEINHYSIRDKELARMIKNPQSYKASEVKKLIESEAFTVEELIHHGLATKQSIQTIFEDIMAGCKYASDFETIEGFTDVFFFGCTGAGKTSLLEGLIGCNGQGCIFNYEKHGGPYAMELSKFLEKGLPPSPNVPFVTTINGAVGNKAVFHPINLVEMDGWTFVNKIVDCEERCGFAKTREMLNDKNRKVFFIVVDPTMDLVDVRWSNDCPMRQLEVLDKFVASFEMPENKEYMRNVDAIHFIVTKAETLGETQEERNRNAHDLLIDRHRGVVYKLIDYCRRAKRINRTTGFQPRIFTFSLGKFYLGNVFEYDNKDSHYLIDALSQMTYGIKQVTIMNRLFKPLRVVKPKCCYYGVKINIE